MRPTYIIAEAGVNHNGSLEIALELVRQAKAAGADAVKFQTFRAGNLVTKTAGKAAYQQRTTPGSQSHYEMLRQLELSETDHEALFSKCRESDIDFLSSPFDEGSADLLDGLGASSFKIGSGEITNLPFLRHVAGKGKPIILSTGMSTLSEVDEAVSAITGEGNHTLTLLHCVTEYPAPVAEVNLNAMLTLKQAFGFPVGYSDHTPGNEIAVAAVALGAGIIEKHLTLDRSDAGPDHAASLDPREFTDLVTAIRNVESALGDGRKRPASCELGNTRVARKSLVAAVDLEKGHRLTSDDIRVKRPGDGIPPKHRDLLVGFRLRRVLSAESVIRWDDLK